MKVNLWETSPTGESMLFCKSAKTDDQEGPRQAALTGWAQTLECEQQEMDGSRLGEGPCTPAALPCTFCSEIISHQEAAKGTGVPAKGGPTGDLVCPETEAVVLGWVPQNLTYTQWPCPGLQVYFPVTFSMPSLF